MQRKIKSLLVFGVISAMSNVAYSKVANISAESFEQLAAQDAYWVATVTCDDESKRVIRRKTDGEEWCGKDIEGFCGADKKSVAEQVCGTGYSAAMSQVEDAKRARSQAAEAQTRARRAEERQQAEQQRLARQRAQQQKEEAAAEASDRQISIEEELLKIEQEKLDLRRQELELQRRAVEIEALLEDKTKT